MTEKSEVGENRKRAKTGGREKGTPNRVTAILKDAILQAAENAGGGDLVTYLTQQAKDHPGPYLTLIGKVLPLQVKGGVSHTAEDALTQLLADVALRGRRITDRN